MKTLKLAFVGFGNAAQAFAKIVINRREALNQMGFNIVASVVITASKGNCYNPKGIQLKALIDDIDQFNAFKSSDLCLTSVQGIDLLEKGDYDVLIELSPLNIKTGQPAIDHIRVALNRHKHVITANKGPIAWAYNALKDLAQQKQAMFLYETTVMDGTPVFNLYRETLPLCQVTGIKGILNSTTNFILESMEAGLTYNEAMIEGHQRGFVEADPSMDIEGFDAAAKLCALMNVMMDADMTPDQIQRIGIGEITVDQISIAKNRGQKIKLICEAFYDHGQIRGTVKPTEVACTDIYAQITGTSSVVTITTDLMGSVSILEHDPELEQTGFGVFSDLIYVMKHLSE